MDKYKDEVIFIFPEFLFSQAKGTTTYNKALVHILELGDVSIED